MRIQLSELKVNLLKLRFFSLLSLPALIQMKSYIREILTKSYLSHQPLTAIYALFVSVPVEIPHFFSA